MGDTGDNSDRKVALVTGAGSGIGRAVALKFAELGYRVVVADFNETDNTATADTINSKGGTAVPVTTDVSKSADVQHMVQTAVTTFGRLDYAVNSAGVCITSPVWDTSEEDFDRMIAVNLRGVFLCMKYELPAMMDNAQFPAVVNISSIAGLRGMLRSGAYSATKAGVIRLSECAAADAGGRVRVNCICPGLVRTPLLEQLLSRAGAPMPGAYAPAPGVCPMNRLGEPEEIAEAVAFLCSDAARYVHGASLVVDGAATSHTPVAV